MSDLLLGIDVGTTNVKALLATPDGRAVAQATYDYPTQRPRPGWAEQNPADWWQGVVHVTRTVLAASSTQPDQIKGIGISGQGCAVTLIDTQGDVIRPAIIWMDARSEPQCEQMRQRSREAILRINGKEPAPYNADPTLMWLQQHEPESIAAARTSLTSTGYITFRLTGEAVENVSDASILFAFDQAAGDWSEALIEVFGLPRKLYPRLAPCSAVIGTVRADAADELGLAAGIPVVAGGEDTSSAGLAMGVAYPGQALLSLGTAGTLYVVQAEAVVHPQLLAFQHALAGQTLLGGSMIAVGAALEWCRQLLAQHDFPALSALAAESEAGADGLIFLPYLSGELQPINDGNARGVFFGLSLNTRQPQLVRAVMEGAAYAIAHNILIADRVGTPISEIRVVGGPTRSRVWCQIMADVTGRRLAVMGDNPGAPLGDALLAGMGAGLIDNIANVAIQAAHVDQYYEPQVQHYKRYTDLFEIYQRLYPKLKDEYAALAGLEAAL